MGGNLMKRQTVTDYLYNKVMDVFVKYHEEDVPTIDFGAVITEAFITAKAMEKEQIIDAYKSDRHPCSDEDAEQYYNDTYGN
jgi:hypothetical protein